MVAYCYHSKFVKEFTKKWNNTSIKSLFIENQTDIERKDKKILTSKSNIYVRIKVRRKKNFN